MKLQKLLVVAASVCLMAFFSVSSFAEGVREEAGAGTSRADITAQALRDGGYAAVSRGNVLELETADGVLTVDLPDDGDSTVALDGVEADASDAGDLWNLSRCLDAVDLIEAVKDTNCELHVTVLGDLLCKTQVTLETIMNDLQCLVAYAQGLQE